MHQISDNLFIKIRDMFNAVTSGTVGSDAGVSRQVGSGCRRSCLQLSMAMRAGLCFARSFLFLRVQKPKA